MIVLVVVSQIRAGAVNSSIVQLYAATSMMNYSEIEFIAPQPIAIKLSDLIKANEHTRVRSLSGLKSHRPVRKPRPRRLYTNPVHPFSALTGRSRRR
jgi:hypothetical protein